MGKKRKIFRLTHLFIGLVAGLIVFIEAITGALWVFNQEIEGLFTDEIKIEQQDIPKVTPTRVKEIAQQEIPGKNIHGVLYNKGAEPIEVIFYEEEPEFYYSIFLNPYDGEVLKHEDHFKGFFPFILDGHLHLWLPHDIGEPVVAYGTLLFLISIITGIVLWWPKNKKGRKQRFKLAWKPTTRWRRKNFDLHTVLGFYVSALAIIFVITGLVMSLEWFNTLFYKSIGGDKVTEFMIPANESKERTIDHDQKPIDQLPRLLDAKYPMANSYEIHFPYADSVSIYVEVSYDGDVYYDADYVFFDQYTLEEVKAPSIYGKYEEASVQDHAVRMSYDIHVGAIWGLPTKVLAFLASLLIATLPVTGVLIYIGRKKKSQQTPKKEREMVLSESM
ncbi:MAG: PepSY-associated TM helix domain-containing protein [Candidatus Cyclobacteriaceae bacterium M2_1C_046]